MLTVLVSEFSVTLGVMLAMGGRADRAVVARAPEPTGGEVVGDVEAGEEVVVVAPGGVAAHEGALRARDVGRDDRRIELVPPTLLPQLTVVLRTQAEPLGLRALEAHAGEGRKRPRAWSRPARSQR